MAHGKRTSQKIQLLKNKCFDYIFYISFVVCGLWLNVMQVDVYKLDLGAIRIV